MIIGAAVGVHEGQAGDEDAGKQRRQASERSF